MNRSLSTLCPLIVLLLVGCSGPSGLDPSGDPAAFSGGAGDPAPPDNGGDPAADDDSAEDGDGPVAEVCDNGVDDDQDGLTDCVDPECAAQPACSPDAEVVTTQTIELAFLSEYFDDGQEVWQSDSVSATGRVEQSGWTGSEWVVLCSSTFSMIGAAVAETTCADCQLQLELVVAAVGTDGCGGPEDVDLVVRVGLSEETVAAGFADGRWEDWEVVSGLVDWSSWIDATTWSVQTLQPLVLQSPEGT